MSTYLKSVFHTRIGLPNRKPVFKNQIIEIDDDTADRLLTRTVFNEELGKDVPVWEKVTAAAYKAQDGKVEEPDQDAPKPDVSVPQQRGNTNPTGEVDNDDPDNVDVVKGDSNGEDHSDRSLRLSSEGEESPEAKAAREAAEAEAKGKQTETTTETKPAAKVATKPAAKPAAKRPTKPAAQRPAKTK